VRQTARAAAQALPPGGTLFVANYHATIYGMVGVLPPTPYAFPAHLSGVLADVTGVDSQAELERVLALPPDVVIVQRDRWEGIRPEAREAVLAVLPAYLRVASIVDGGRPVEVWRRR
jgi:ABC-type Fe3+-hydroxamate transport system substrate-binding protein